MLGEYATYVMLASSRIHFHLDELVYQTDHRILQVIVQNRLRRYMTETKLDLRQNGIIQYHTPTQSHSIDARWTWTHWGQTSR